MSKTITTLEIDYSRYGHSKRITVPLFNRERTIAPGDRVRILGDDVPPRSATVIAVLDNGRQALLEIDDAS
jgi:hypothetical protein